MQVSKQVVYGAAVAFLALFGAVLFLLGRESARRHIAPVASAAGAMQPADPAPTVAPPPAVPPLPSTTTPAPATAPTPIAPVPSPNPRSGIVESDPRAGVVESDPRAMPASVSVVVDGDGKGAVRDYFTRMQAIQTVGPAGDTGDFANQLLTTTMNGDTTGLDELVRATEAGAAKAGAITPPPACADYHHRMIAMLSESVGMVKQIKRAIASGDAQALTALAASGTSLQNRASALEDEAKRIKSQFGVR